MRIDLVMLVKNEIEALRIVCPTIPRSLFSSVAVCDGNSTDGSYEFCREQGYRMFRDPPIPSTLPTWLNPMAGYIVGLSTLFENLDGDALLAFPPDGSSDPSVLPLMCRLLETHDVVNASRYMGDQKSEDDDFLTAAGNWVFTRMVNLLCGTNHTDVLCGYRGYRREAVKRMRLTEHGAWIPSWAWETSSACRAKRCGLTYVEIPAAEPQRIGGVRKMQPIVNGCGVAVNVIRDWLVFFSRRAGG